MERLGQPRNRGLNKRQLLLWGMLFLLSGMFSRSVLQNRVLQIGSLTGQQLLDVMSASGAAMVAATAALVMQALETCAIPIFAYLLVDGFEKFKTNRKGFLFLLVTAVVSEIPHNFVVSGQLLYTRTRNPAIALVIAAAVLYFFYRYSENSFKNVLIKIGVGLAAVLWVIALNVDHGVALLVVIMTMWPLRKKKQTCAMFGAVASTACVLVSPFYLASGMGVLPVHFYHNDEEETAFGFLMYLAYPILLSGVAALTFLI